MKTESHREERRKLVKSKKFFIESLRLFSSLVSFNNNHTQQIIAELDAVAPWERLSKRRPSTMPAAAPPLSPHARTAVDRVLEKAAVARGPSGGAKDKIRGGEWRSRSSLLLLSWGSGSPRPWMKSLGLPALSHFLSLSVSEPKIHLRFPRDISKKRNESKRKTKRYQIDGREASLQGTSGVSRSLLPLPAAAGGGRAGQVGYVVVAAGAAVVACGLVGSAAVLAINCCC